MIDLRFVPITQWPGKPTSPRKGATFRTSYPKVLDKLEFELKKLQAREIMIQAFYAFDQIRNDGWPKSTAKPTNPGVILSFKKPDGPVFYRDGKPMVKLVPLSFPCDTYDRMEHNIYAIALSLEALRAVDRHGVTKNAEQYTGWRQIEAPKQEFGTAEEAAQFLAMGTGFEPDTLIRNADARKDAYRAQARRYFVEGGTEPNAEMWDKVQKAKALLEVATQ